MTKREICNSLQKRASIRPTNKILKINVFKVCGKYDEITGLSWKSLWLQKILYKIVEYEVFL